VPAPANAENGFPRGVPLEQMTTDQQVAYWRHYARQHEQRVKDMADYDRLKEIAAQHEQLVQSTQSEHEKAVAEARRQGAAEAAVAASDQLVEAYVRAAAVNRLTDERVNALLENLDRRRFVSNGQVDTDKVWQFVATIAPPAAPAAPAEVQPPAPTVPPTPAPTAPVAAPTWAQSPPSQLDLGQGQYPNTPVSPLDAGKAAARARLAARRPATQPS
jgi:hypothetical protein